MERLNLRNVRIFADGADKQGMLKQYADPRIAGFTTNPTLMRKAGISNYEEFAQEMVRLIPDRELSFEVFSDDFVEMRKQATRIASWGSNVFVKIPVTNTKGESSVNLLRCLAGEGIKVNVTAIFTVDQVRVASDALRSAAETRISVFAGRIADAGVDPMPIMQEALRIIRERPHQQLIWASPREVFNIVQADSIGCHIITVTSDILSKLPGLGKDLGQFSLETVRMFYTDAQTAGFSI